MNQKTKLTTFRAYEHEISEVNKALRSSGDQRKKKQLLLSYGGLSLSLKGVDLGLVDKCCIQFLSSVIFVSLLVVGLEMSAYEGETKEK